MTNSVIDWPSLVTVRVAKMKTVSIDCLFKGNQADINYALLTLSELLKQVLMKASFDQLKLIIAPPGRSHLLTLNQLDTRPQNNLTNFSVLTQHHRSPGCGSTCCIKCKTAAAEVSQRDFSLLSLCQTPHLLKAPTWTQPATWQRAACAPSVETEPPANTTGPPAATAARASLGAAFAKTTCTHAGEDRKILHVYNLWIYFVNIWQNKHTRLQVQQAMHCGQG